MGRGRYRSSSRSARRARVVSHTRRCWDSRAGSIGEKALRRRTWSYTSRKCFAQGEQVVGKFVEFFGEGVRRLTVPDPRYDFQHGARIRRDHWLFPRGRAKPAGISCKRDVRKIMSVRWRRFIARRDSLAISQQTKSTIPKFWNTISPPWSPACRVRNARRIVFLHKLKDQFATVLREKVENGGYGRNGNGAGRTAPDRSGEREREPRDGDVVIAAITSCTNTSNPGLMLMAGLVAKKAVELGLRAKPWVKTSLTPGSTVVGEYLNRTGLQGYLDALGFAIAGYSCATCVGNSGPIDSELEKSIVENGTVACAVLSGNRNFEGRIHPAVRAAFLASPPLVVAFALVGHVDIDLESEPIGCRETGEPVYLRDLWPTAADVDRAFTIAAVPQSYKQPYSGDVTARNPAVGVHPESDREKSIPGTSTRATSKSRHFSMIACEDRHCVKSRTRAPLQFWEIRLPPITSVPSVTSRAPLPLVYTCKAWGFRQLTSIVTERVV